MIAATEYLPQLSASTVQTRNARAVITRPAVKRVSTERSFASHDGEKLFYRHWPQSTVKARGAVVMLHRGHEHSGRMAHLVDELGLPDFAFFAWDARGHGQSPGARGDAPGFAHVVRDLDCFVAHIAETHGIAVEDIAVVAQSVGAVVAATWAHDYAPRIRCLSLASPAFGIKLYVPFARTGLKLLRKIRGEFFINSYVKGRLLSHDPARIESFDADPLVTRAISVKMLLELHDAAKRVVADAAAIAVPTQLLISGGDWVVRSDPQHDFFEQLGSAFKEKHVFDGFFHDTLGERDRAEAVALLGDFVTRAFATPMAQPSRLDADQAGFTHDEAEALGRKLSPFSPRGLYWAGVRAMLRLGGRLSAGLKLGHAAGFDSGSMLDYVYRNEPAGLGRVGRFIDRLYLNSIGWRGIRRRKEHVEEMIALADGKLAQARKPLRTLDIAAGHGRYVLDAVAKATMMPDAILLRDYSPRNVELGNALIRERGLSDWARFEIGDAFDAKGLAAIAPRPTLGIVSGLYELFADNAMVARSLAGLAAAIEPGGYLIYTNQPWHPQLAFIARGLTSHRLGQAWVMRRRTQVEMDQLVARAGFRKLDQRVDPWGIFTVSLAVRTAR